MLLGLKSSRATTPLLPSPTPKPRPFRNSHEPQVEGAVGAFEGDPQWHAALFQHHTFESNVTSAVAAQPYGKPRPLSHSSETDPTPLRAADNALF